MLRRVPAVVVVAAAAVGCSPTFDVPVAWTVDGEDPAAVCEFLPAGSVVRMTAISRDTSDKRNSAPRETTADLGCADGSGTIQTGNFAEVRAELVAGDDVYGTSTLIDFNPGAPASGYQIEDEPIVADIRLIRGTLTANFTVVGQGCADAGASSFTVSLFQNTEPRANVAVVEDVNVPCEDGVATFTHSPVDIDSIYVIEASTTTISEANFSTSSAGDGVRTVGANTFTTVDLQAAE